MPGVKRTLPKGWSCWEFEASFGRQDSLEKFMKGRDKMEMLLQSCPTLCNPTDNSPPGPAVPGILQARTLEWVPISFSNA